MHGRAMSTPGAAPYITAFVMAHAHSDFLKDAVASALAQSLDRAEFEILVVKDYSDPELDHWLDERGVRVVTEELPRMGQMRARGVELARGEVVCFLDDDDRFRPEKLAGVAAAFRADPHLSLLHNVAEAIDGLGQPLTQWSRARPRPPSARTIDPARDGASAQPWIARYGGYINVSSTSVRRAALLPNLAGLAEITASDDLFIPVAALLSGGRQRFESAAWNDVRIRLSTSHRLLGSGTLDSELAELKRAERTATLLRRLVDGLPHSALAYRLVYAFLWEVRIVEYLLDRSAHLDLESWAGYGRAVVWRRQRYLLRDWALATLRPVLPGPMTRYYRRRRARDLGGPAAAGPSADSLK
jgi:glycosyltransferase involved in cell wall biosynthesis